MTSVPDEGNVEVSVERVGFFRDRPELLRELVQGAVELGQVLELHLQVRRDVVPVAAHLEESIEINKIKPK